MPLATKYHVLVYSGQDGYQSNRAQIQLEGTNGKPIAWIRFNDPGMTFETDYESNGIIRMHLPSTMFQSVLDMLRNEDPINIYFNGVRAFFATGTLEPVGENE